MEGDRSLEGTMEEAMMEQDKYYPNDNNGYYPYENCGYYSHNNYGSYPHDDSEEESLFYKINLIYWLIKKGTIRGP